MPEGWPARIVANMQSQEEGRMIFGLTNSKGGVGKMTIAVHLAAFLAKKKRKVVFIDAVPQQSASRSCR